MVVINSTFAVSALRQSKRFEFGLKGEHGGYHIFLFFLFAVGLVLIYFFSHTSVYLDLVC